MIAFSIILLVLKVSAVLNCPSNNLPPKIDRNTHADYTCLNAHQCLPGEICIDGMTIATSSNTVSCGTKEKCKIACCTGKAVLADQPQFNIQPHGFIHVLFQNRQTMEESVLTRVGVAWAHSCDDTSFGGTYHVAGSIFRPLNTAEWNLMSPGEDNRGQKETDVWIATEAGGITINHIGPWNGPAKQKAFLEMYGNCPQQEFKLPTATDIQVASIGNDNNRYILYAAGLFSIVGLVMAVFYGSKWATKGDQLHANYTQLTNENV